MTDTPCEQKIRTAEREIHSMKTLRIVACCLTLVSLAVAQAATEDYFPLVEGSYSLESSTISSTLTVEFKHGQGALLSAEAVLLAPSAHYGTIDNQRMEMPQEHEAQVGIYRGQGCAIELRGTRQGLHAEQNGRCEDFGMGVDLTGDYLRTTPYYDDIRLDRVEAPEPGKSDLFIANFRVTYYPPNGREPEPQSGSYRIYCPTRMVRNIGNGTWDDARKVEAEDARRFSGRYVVRAVLAQVCNQDL